MDSKWFQRFTSLSENLVKLLLIAAEVFLLFLSILRTSVVSGYEERSDYAIDKPLFHVLVLFGTGILLFLVRRFVGSRILDRLLKWTAGILFFLNLLLALYLVQNTQFQPLGDSSILWDIACRMWTGNYVDFLYLGYAERHFNQMGALFFLKTLVSLVGPEDQHILQILNVVALSVFQISLYNITARLFSKTAARAVIILCILFLPLSLYVVFTYFNLISWALIALAFWQEISLFETGKKRHLASMTAAVFFAVLLKSFSWIAVIAMVVYACYEGLRKKQFLPLIGMAIAVTLILTASFAMKQTILSKTGADRLRTMPAMGYVAMGMQESYMAPGWYNGVHDRTYVECEGEPALMDRAFKEMIQLRLQEFKAAPKYMAWFYYLKMASQWNNPSFQGFWFGEISTPRVAVPQNIQSLYAGSLRPHLDRYLNYLLTVIHAGVLLWVVLDFKQIRLKHLLGIIYFLGGFLFLILWEAKCQYTLGFFVFLLPYSICGYRALYRRDYLRKVCFKRFGHE